MKTNIKVIEKIVSDKEGKLVSEDRKSGRFGYKVICKNDHEFFIKAFDLNNGSWCQKCLEVNTHDVISLVKEKGYELLTAGELGRITRINVKCPIHEHTWETCYHNIKYANGNCKLCSSGLESLQFIKDTITSKNGTLIERIVNKNSFYVINCNIHNEIFKTQWSVIKRGIWCSKCDDDNRKITHEEIKSRVEENSGTLLSKNCSTATQLFKVRCNKDGHEWDTCWARMKQGHWCPKCAGSIKYTVENVQAFIKNKGELLDTEIKNIKQKVKIKCNCGEIFSSELNHIINHDAWCQVCSEGYKEQKKLYAFIKEIYPNHHYKYNYRGFDWLKSRKDSKHRLEIDILVHNDDNSFVLAIEYDGKQHFEPVKFASNMTDEQALKAHKTIKKNDKIKNKLIKLHSKEITDFIRFSYKDKINKHNIIEIIEKNNVKVPKPF